MREDENVLHTGDTYRFGENRIFEENEIEKKSVASKESCLEVAPFVLPYFGGVPMGKIPPVVMHKTTLYSLYILAFVISLHWYNRERSITHSAAGGLEAGKTQVLIRSC